MKRNSLTELENRGDFIRRHIGPTPQQQSTMARAMGYDSPDALIEDAVPQAIRRAKPMNLGEPNSERDTLERLRAIAGRNEVFRSFIGCGYHDTFTPPVIQRNVLENPGWYTAYTPYQPEISQGRLEGLLNYQQMVMDLTGLDLANASMLDEGSAAAEAMTLLRRVNKKNRSARFIVAEDCHPQTIAVVRTRARPLDIEVLVGDPAALLDQGEAFGLLLQYPGSRGDLRDIAPLIERAHAANALVAVAADIMALLLVKSPGELGADVAVGNTQRFGVPMGFGGPHSAYFATRDDYKRSTPGRIIGVSIDRRGDQALRMAMQTREQHIRREKATSNICTAQALLALMAGFYAMYHGPDGLRRIAQRIHRYTAILAAALADRGVAAENAHFFDTLTFDVGERTDAVLERAAAAADQPAPGGWHAPWREPGRDHRQGRHRKPAVRLHRRGGRAGHRAHRRGHLGPPRHPRGTAAGERVPATPGLQQLPLRDRNAALPAPLLESKDIALNRAMIPLGSCTMKLNATTEMAAVTWPEFAGIHPFAPQAQTQGYRQLIGELERMLLECTGYDAISMQPNAGSQGEYAGLLAIKRYHESRGDHQRNVCLIPSSAHGTNPASAALAGLKVVIVECDEQGNVNMDDLRAKADQHSRELACIMVTYPSTHGVFEEDIIELCDTVHAHGGQIYMDGANLNALVGLAAPGQFGADVSHLNLHKTFCIPHGGGGPGMGPIGVGKHLEPFLPRHPLKAPGEDDDVVASAPFGSASILPISWAYIALMGTAGLEQATRVAILSANYVAHRLKDHYPILYKGRNGLVAHECIVDVRPIKEASGITEEDIAKRLIDYGFHAPTMSFPVAGTLMVEPTESESLPELDRFCDAMIAIREEIRAVQEGRLDAQDNPLRNAPHSLADIVEDGWGHPYSRELAAYPVDSLRGDKYWAPVTRIDNAHGDRHLVCSCPDIDSYREAAEG